MKRKLIIFTLLSLMIISFSTYTLLNYSYSEGIKTGKLVKILEQGFFFKTYEGTLDLGSGDKLTWNFSVHHSAIAKELLLKTGTEITLHYTEHLVKMLHDTRYNITGYEVLSQKLDLFHRYFCELISVLRKDENVVEKTRDLIMKYAPHLLEHIKKCQLQDRKT